MTREDDRLAALDEEGRAHARAQARAVRVTLVTANIGRKRATARRVRRNMRAVFAAVAAMVNVVIGWQEVDEADPADEHGILRAIVRRLTRAATRHSRRLARASRRAGWRLIGFGQLVPITIPADAKVQRHRVRPASPGRRRVSPARVVNLVRLLFAGLPDVPFSVLNGHLPFRAPDLWDQAYAAWVRAVDGEVEAGRVVAILMDSNHHGPMPRFHRDQVELVPPDGVDGIDRVIIVIPRELARRGVEARLVRRFTVDLDLDGHNAHGVILDVTSPTQEAA